MKKNVGIAFVILILTVLFAQVAVVSAEEPVTITIKSVSPGKDWELKDTIVGQKIIEETGVNVKFKHSIGDEQQAIGLMIASGDLPDVVAVHAKATPFIESGVAIELTDLIEDYAPNYRKALGLKWNAMKWSMENTGRYFTVTPYGISEPFEQFNWFFLQHAVVIEQGYPEIKTLEQYEKAIKTYIEKHPTINDQPTIGMTLNLDDWRWILSLTNPAMMAAGTESNGEIYVDPDTMEVSYRITRPQEKAYFKWLNGMYHQGLLDKESFTQTYDQYQAKIASGRVLAMADMGWSFGQATQALKAEGKYERTYGAYPLVIKKGNKNASFTGNRTLPGARPQLVITKNCKNPEKFMQLVNFLSTQEGQVLINWGIEGVHYDIIDGKRVVKPGVLEQRLTNPDYTIRTGVGAFDVFSYEDGVKDESGQYYTINNKDNIIDTYSAVDKQVLDAYGLTTWADWFPGPEEFPLRQWPSENSVQDKVSGDALVAYQKVKDIVKKGVVRAVVAKPEEFEATWGLMLEEMKKAGVDTYTDAIEEVINEQLKLYNSEG